MANKITARLVTETSLTIMMGGKTYVLTEDNHQHYTELRAALAAEDVETIERLIDIPKAINTYGGGIISVVNGEVIFEGKPLHNAVTTRLLRQMDEGFNVEPMVAFLTNLMKNPSMTARNELYLWLEENQCPITEDGHFISFKNVRDTYKDWHSNTIDNSVGQKPSMPRNAVDDNRNQTCSAGLHFCSESYLQHFHAGAGTRTMVLKVNPADVVSIPSDYGNAKGRCWQYEVIGEVSPENIKNFYDTPVHGATSSTPKKQEEEDEEEQTEYDVYSSDDKFDYDEMYEGSYATKQGAIDIAKEFHDEHGVSVRVLDGYDNVVYELLEDQEDFDFHPDQTEEGIIHEEEDEPVTLDDVVSVPFPEEAVAIKPVSGDRVASVVASILGTPAPAPALADMLFTKTQAAAILNVNIETLNTLLDSGAKVERVARGGKIWVRIK
jgi:hypothetical protein